MSSRIGLRVTHISVGKMDFYIREISDRIQTLRASVETGETDVCRNGWLVGNIGCYSSTSVMCSEGSGVCRV